MSAGSLVNRDVFFLYGHSGIRKIFIWQTLCASICSRGYIMVQIVASSSIASFQCSMGETAQFRLGIPLAITKDSMSWGIQLVSDLTWLDS